MDVFQICRSIRRRLHASRGCALGAGLMLIIGLVVAGCHTPRSEEGELKRFEYVRPLMGTLFRITLYAPGETEARQAAEAAFDRVSALEDVLSDYQADSEVARLREAPVGVPTVVSQELFEVLERALEIARLSAGAFDPTIGPEVRLWRFARKRKVLPSPQELAEAKRAVGWQKVRLDRTHRTVTFLAPNMRLDMGGIGKGYAADEALKILKERGWSRAIVAASGDIAMGDAPPGQRGWRIGVSGLGTNGVVCTLLLTRAGVSTSGDTEQFIEIDGVRYSHILDPATGLGLTRRVQATVVAREATTSDPTATAVCVLGAERGMRLVERLGAAVLVQAEGERARVSHGFKRLPRVKG